MGPNHGRRMTIAELRSIDIDALLYNKISHTYIYLKVTEFHKSDKEDNLSFIGNISNYLQF